MSVGDGISGLGATRHRWMPAVKAQIEACRRNFAGFTANTYVCHPWCGWGRFSVDFWGPGGRGDPLPDHLGPQLRRFLMNRPGPPTIRHTIWKHELWTSFGGMSRWERNDHDGDLKHLHVTYWRF